MNVNDEKKFLREEITRLRMRLVELDESVESTSSTCGHDVVLEHLKKLTQEHQLEGLCQIAGIHEKNGWYTSNINPAKIKYLLEEPNTVVDYLSIFTSKKVWECLESAFLCELEADRLHRAEEIKILQNNNLIGSDYRLTTNGFLSYCVLGHLAYNVCKKLDIMKSIEIFKEVYEITGTQFGEKLGIDSKDLLKKIAENRALERLSIKGILESDILTYVRQIGD